MRHLVDGQVKLKSFDDFCQQGETLIQELRELIPLKIRIENEVSLSSSSDKLERSQALEKILLAVSSGHGLRNSSKIMNVIL